MLDDTGSTLDASLLALLLFLTVAGLVIGSYIAIRLIRRLRQDRIRRLLLSSISTKAMDA